MVQRFVLCVLMLVSVLPAKGQEELSERRGSQIVDDSTKQIYGPTTSKFFYEQDVFYNNEILYPIDTLIHNFNRITYIERNQYRFQDLGNIGTASRSIFYNVPSYIGVNPGFEVYDLYWDYDKLKYFDTKSPYTNLRLVLGGRGRSMTKVTFSRNINPRWNFGFDFRGLYIDKQVQRQGKGDRNVRSTYYDLFTTYHSKDSSYRLFMNLGRTKHFVNEYGGVAVGEDYDIGDFFEQNISPVLTAASTEELRMNLHLFHQYKVGSALQLYHVLDRYRQGNDFNDTPASEPADYFDFTAIDSTETRDRAKFTTLRNEVGVKGNLARLFYNGYYAIRHFNMEYKYIEEDTLRVRTRGDEHYIGGRMALQLDSIFKLLGWVEVLDNGNFRIEGSLKSKWLQATLKQNKYEPGFMYQAYRGSHDVWNNDFSPVDVTQLNGYIFFRSKALTLSPGITFTRLNNYVYFDENPTRLQHEYVYPQQSTGSQVIMAPEFRFTLTFLKNVTLQGQAIYTSLLENANSAISVPELFVNGQLAYQNIFFKGNLDMQAGFDIHWQSDYTALNYDPVIQQFYLQYPQGAFQSNAFPIVDVFFNAKIKRGRIFVKYTNLVQAFTKEGYFPTPYYPGQSNVIDFGFDWSFYD